MHNSRWSLNVVQFVHIWKKSWSHSLLLIEKISWRNVVRISNLTKKDSNNHDKNYIYRNSTIENGAVVFWSPIFCICVFLFFYFYCAIYLNEIINILCLVQLIFLMNSIQSLKWILNSQKTWIHSNNIAAFTIQNQIVWFNFANNFGASRYFVKIWWVTVMCD